MLPAYQENEPATDQPTIEGRTKTEEHPTALTANQHTNSSSSHPQVENVVEKEQEQRPKSPSAIGPAQPWSYREKEEIPQVGYAHATFSRTQSITEILHRPLGAPRPTSSRISTTSKERPHQSHDRCPPNPSLANSPRFSATTAAGLSIEANPLPKNAREMDEASLLSFRRAWGVLRPHAVRVFDSGHHTRQGPGKRTQEFDFI